MVEGLPGSDFAGVKHYSLNIKAWGRPRCRVELPPVSWTTKLKSRKWEAFHVYKSGIEA